ncbi:DUF6708 domain-containing protein [uncultured Herbaspirillum sp.]|uniref:DUF6708 domain-containing protein n=1 Tax=uncultured Herbaspirillum sp. TaxID=160236 RepID=UPI002589AB3A|nr:DUF6708 domain-containing protein [uncultured Herbaspirillum sp.]
MDERAFPYKVGQPVPEWDLRHRLPIEKPVSSECQDAGTIFRINSTYMDVTDQPYMYRQDQVFLVLIFAFTSVILAVAPIWIFSNSVPDLDIGTAVIFGIAIGTSIHYARITFKHGRDEFFSLRRRPIRFHRKEKKIYAIRRRRFFAKPGQGDVTWEVPWNDSSIFCIHYGMVHFRRVYHIRCYEVDQNGNVIRAFSIGRSWQEHEGLEGLLAQWNYWCRYMNQGPGELPSPRLYFKEREDRAESFLFCIGGFDVRIGPIFLRLLIIPFVLMETSHRLLALWTCRDPIWPDAVSSVSVIDPEDPYNQPSWGTPVGWAETGNAIDRDEYPNGDKREMKNWHGKKDPAANTLLWAQDTPPLLK